MLDYSKENKLLTVYPSILGIDEAGRGPWAGPLVIAGVLIDGRSSFIPGVDDSKKLGEAKRANLFDEITKTHQYYITIVSHTEIDTLGVGNAQIKGMNHLIAALTAAYILIDGYFKPDSFEQPVECVIDGDALCYSIAAASIIAKHTRDALMNDLDEKYPGYNFKKHKGYGTKEHAEKLRLLGPSEIHRKSYRPVRDLL